MVLFSEKGTILKLDHPVHLTVGTRGRKWTETEFPFQRSILKKATLKTLESTIPEKILSIANVNSGFPTRM